MNIAWCVQRWSELNPHKTAVIFTGERISYAMLHNRANQVACWLQSMGIEKGDRVAGMMENSPQFLDLYLACARIGAIFVPINFRLAGPELVYILQNARPRLFVFGEKYAEMISGIAQEIQRPLVLLASIGAEPTAENVLDYNNEVSEFEGRKPFLADSLGPISPEEPHVIMYTSGTTGKPKGAVLSHRKTFFNCLNADIFFKLEFDDVMLIVLPLFHSGGLFIQASPVLYKGATMILPPRFEPKEAYQDIFQYHVTKFLGVPTIYRALLRERLEKDDHLDSLKVCAIGGEKATPGMMEQFKRVGFSLRQIMGQTETSILLWASEKDVIRKRGSVGRPVFHAEVDIVDREGKRVRPGEVGEIVVRGSIMMTEYWQDPVRTEETIRDGWLHTGDLARRDDDGYYYFVDRAKNMYISGGENVYPAEVERVLREHPAIEEIAVVGVPNDLWGETGHAFVIKKKGATLTEEEVTSFCNGRLAKYKWPKGVTFCEEFPKTSLGKIQKNVLLNNYLNEQKEILTNLDELAKNNANTAGT